MTLLTLISIILLLAIVAGGLTLKYKADKTLESMEGFGGIHEKGDCKGEVVGRS